MGFPTLHPGFPPAWVMSSTTCHILCAVAGTPSLGPRDMTLEGAQGEPTSAPGRLRISIQTSDDICIIYTVDGCEILHQLKTMVNIPLFCLGFNHPFGDAGFLSSTSRLALAAGFSPGFQWLAHQLKALAL